MPRLLVFAPHCYPPAGAEALVTVKLLQVLSQAKWKLDVIAHRGAGLVYPSSIQSAWRFLHDIVHALPDKVPPSSTGEVVCQPGNRLDSLRWVGSAYRLGAELIRRNSYDAILSRIMPQYGHLPALLLSGTVSVPWIASWSDPLPTVKAPKPYGQGYGGKASRIQMAYCRSVARRATWHVFPCERLRKYMIRYLPEISPKSCSIPHPALTGCEVRPPAEKTDFVLCHAGGLGKRNVENFLVGVADFLCQEPCAPVRLRFVGRDSNLLREPLRRLNLESRTELIPALPYSEVQKLLSEAAALVLIEADCLEGIFLPAKVSDYIQTTRPILAVSPREGTCRDLLVTNGGGVAVDVSSTGDIADGISLLYRSWKKNTLEQDYSTVKLQQTFDEKEVLDLWAQLIERVKR